ncbi:MAG: DUF3256 family protein [Prevotella sp.]|nr:DUF3256 family protein [Prevotella sp.]
MAELFKTMPDSLLPYLSKNNRLDMLDFMAAGMKAEVVNLLDGKSEMLVLNSDSLSIRLNSIVQLDMKLIILDTPIDSSKIGIRVHRTYTINENQTEHITDEYSSVWHLLQSHVERSSLLLRDDRLLQPATYF